MPLLVLWSLLGAVAGERSHAAFTADRLVWIQPADLAHKIEEKRAKRYFFNLVDLRLEVDFLKGGIPGAVNIPLVKLRFVAEREFDKSEDLVLYGYSRDDRASVNAVVLLVNKGYGHVMLLEGGWEAWHGQVRDTVQIENK